MNQFAKLSLRRELLTVDGETSFASHKNIFISSYHRNIES